VADAEDGPFGFVREAFNLPSVSEDDLLRIKQEQVLSEKAYFEALRDYWIARALLARAVGGGILTETAAPASTPASPPAPAPPPGRQPMGGMDGMDMGKMQH
jgi:hypothetical protein